MRKITLTISCMLLIACTTIHAQTEAEMKAWTDYMTPGEMHKMLAKSVGTWTGKVTLWMTPGVPPTTSTSTATVEMQMDGRYQVTHHEGDIMGMAFKGFGLVAFDNAKKVFISTWVDNMGTGVMTLEGPWDPATKSITLKGKTVDPTTGKDMNVREVFKIIDDNTQSMEMYGPDPKSGKEYRTMEILYTRNK